MDRSKEIIKTSMIGIAVNIVLIIVKIMIGLITNSIAIILDAVNTLGDTLGSMITIVGTKLAGRNPDKDHPYGYGRIEYITSIIVAVIILVAGFTACKESIEKIIHPEEATYTTVSLIIVGITVIGKFLLGRYVKGVGKKIDSGALIASGEDATIDSILTLSTVIAGLISMLAHISLEGYVGVVLSIVLLKAGYEVLKETLDSIIGTRAEYELSVNIKKDVASIEGVNGAYDLVIHDYGPNSHIGQIHIEVPDTMKANEIDQITRKIQNKIAEKYGFFLTVGIYASNDTDPKTVEMKNKVADIVGKYKAILQFHGFYVDFEKKYMSFDIVVDFKYDRNQTRAEVIQQIQEIYPDYKIIVQIDISYTD